jgi:hypothetical protein
MKKLIILAGLVLSSLFASGQTVYTTTQDACSGTAHQACYNIPVVDQNNMPGFISMDNRSVNLQYNFYLGAYANNGIHGTYDGFVGNPDGTRNDFNGVASFVSDSGTVEAQLQFHAYYVKTCSGRGCGGTLGWHFRLLAGSTVTVN